MPLDLSAPLFSSSTLGSEGAVDQDTLELPFLSNLGLMLTFRCTTACPHCVVEAGPHRKEEIALDRALDWIEQAREFRGGHILGWR